MKQAMTHTVFALTTCAICLLSGCSSLSGLDAKDTFTCKATGGVSCESMTSIYNRTQAGTLPAQQQSPTKASEVPSTYRGRESAQLAGTTLTSGQPLRSQEELARLWIAPWRDIDGDLHDASYVYKVIGQSRWLIEHTTQQIMTTFGPRRAVPKDSAAQTAKPESATVTPAGVMDIAKDPAAADIIKRMMGGQAQ